MSRFGGSASIAGDRDGDGAPIRAIVADDSVLLREGIVRLLGEGGIDVVGQAGDAEDLIRKTRSQRPDIVVVDIRMPPTHTSEGIEAAKLLRSEFPNLAVLVLSQYVEELYTSELLADSATGFGYLMKDRVVNVREFLEALHRVAAGGSAIDPQIVSQMVGRSSRNHALDKLTKRELETLELMAEGFSNTAIASQMTISRRAVEKYVSLIFNKLDIPEESEGNRRVLAVLEYLRQN
ncbi:MAG: response regulator transcription factor [Solirubrobacterales bacterium]